MIKIIIAGLVALLSFAGTLVGMLAFTGNLSQEKLRALVSEDARAALQAEKQAEEEANTPRIGTLAFQLKEREKALNERSAALDAREKQLAQREADLEKTRAELETLQAAINETYDVAAEDREAQMKTIAITLENMEAEGAAQSLESMPTDEAAEILMSVKDKKRGEILDAMAVESAARILKEIRDSRS